MKRRKLTGFEIITGQKEEEYKGMAERLGLPKFVHPEQKEGEVFVFNRRKGDYDSTGYVNIRRGKIAYGGVTREPVDGYVPVFVDKKEYDRREKQIEEREV